MEEDKIIFIIIILLNQNLIEFMNLGEMLEVLGSGDVQSKELGEL